MKPGEQEPTPEGQAPSEGKTYTEKEFNEKVSAELGRRLGPIPSQTLEVFAKDPKFMNKMLVTQSIIEADPALRAKVAQIMGENAPENRVEVPNMDIEKLIAESQAEAGVELDDKTKKVLSAFTKRLGAVTVQAASQAGSNAAQKAAPEAVRQLTREEQWEWVKSQEDVQKNRILLRTTRDILNEFHAQDKKITPVEAYEMAKKELDPNAKTSQTSGSAPTVSQPRQSSAQAAGQRGAAQQATSDSGSGGEPPRKTYRDLVAERIDEAAWKGIVEAAVKRFG